MKSLHVDIRGKGKRRLEFLWAVGLSFLWIILVWKGLGIYFETNDDKYIAEILSGSITGKADAHTVYLNYLLAAPLAFLYRRMPGIPWYGGMLVMFHVLTYSVMLLGIWSRCEKAITYMVATGFVGCFALINLDITVNLQFTSTAALLAVTGYICLILHKNSQKGKYFFVLLELLAFLVRDQAMLMIQPIGGGIWTGLNLVSENTEWREKLKRTGEIFLFIGIVVLVGTVGSLHGYRGEEWRKYSRFNDALVTLFDYCGKPDYEEVKHILEQYDVTQTEYVAFCNGVMLDGDISVECVEELASYAKQKEKKNIDIVAILRQIWSMEKSSNVNKNKVVAVAWWGTLIWVFILGRYYLMIPLAGIALGRTIVWGYLIYEGRMPARVTNPLISGEIFLLVILLIWDYYTREKKLEIQKPLAVFLYMFFGFCCLLAGWGQYGNMKGTREWQEAYMKGLLEIQHYCNDRPEQRYLLDAWSFSYYTGSAFETRIYGRNNCVYTGGWFTNTPVRHLYLQQYFKGHEKDIHLIVYDEGNKENYCAVKYMTEKLGVTPVLTDEITVSFGGVYLVWYFGADNAD